jgi:hypothetical protein
VLDSAEFNLGSRYIAGLYVGLLNRDAEYEGWQFQRSALLNKISDPILLAGNFLNSEEFKARNGILSDAEFIRLLYRQILLREPAQSEVDGYVQSMSRGRMESPRFSSVTRVSDGLGSAADVVSTERGAADAVSNRT